MPKQDDLTLFTSESVSPGHPDKLCDQISDCLVDEFLRQDPHSHVAIEALATQNHVVIAGEVHSGAMIDPARIEYVVREQIQKVGYDPAHFDAQHVPFHNFLHQQSPEITALVKAQQNKAQGAGDQGMMFGFACNETEILMPAALYYAHRILHQLHTASPSPLLGPDAKSQVTLQYRDHKPVGVHNVVVSIQHHTSLSLEDVYEYVKPVILSVFPEGWIQPDTPLRINFAGSFHLGGPAADTGVTGRKIIMDTYGGSAPHGGGAFSGKDGTKVDRSGAYACRYLAKNIVAAGLAERCTLQISYAIGVAEPLSFYVNTHGTGVLPDVYLAAKLMEYIDLTPASIEAFLSLKKPIYLPTATFGHFGRTPTPEGHFSWEKLDLIGWLQQL